MKRDPLSLIAYLLDIFNQVYQKNLYPTNKQLLKLVQDILTFSPTIHRCHGLSCDGKGKVYIN